MVVLAQQAGGNTAVQAKVAEGSLISTSGTPRVTVLAAGVQGARDWRTTGTACLSGALMRRMEEWERLTLLEPSCRWRSGLKTKKKTQIRLIFQNWRFYFFFLIFWLKAPTDNYQRSTAAFYTSYLWGIFENRLKAHWNILWLRQNLSCYLEKAQKKVTL